MTITFVGAGAAQTGHNAATLSPPLHASTAAGDVVVLHASIRGTAASMTVAGGSTPWVLLADNGHQRLFGKVAAAGEPTPTVTFTGGSVGDDNFAQCATWRGVEPSVENTVGSTSSNGSAQNISYASLDLPGDGMALIVAGWKQDDWTSVATLAGMTEIAETFATTGNDAGQVWDYQIQTTVADLVSGSFVVTGGAAAIGRGLSLGLRRAAAISVQEQDAYPPRTLVTVTDLTGGDDVVVYRVVAGQRTALRAGSVANATDPSLLVVDAELPFGVPVGYVAVVNGGAEYATSLTTYDLSGAKAVVTDAITGLAAEVLVGADSGKTRTRNAARYNVGGRNIVVSGAMSDPEGSYDFVTEAWSSYENLLDVLANATEGVVQVRQPGGYNGFDAYLAIDATTEKRMSQDGTDDKRILNVQYAETEAWAEDLEARGFTYQDVSDYYGTGTYANAAAEFVTYLAAEQADYS